MPRARRTPVPSDVATVLRYSRSGGSPLIVKRTYRLVLLSADETRVINKANRSDISKDRIADAGIKLMPGRVTVEVAVMV